MPPIGWSAWFRAAQLNDAPRGGPRFSQADHALDAALAGGGVALGRVTLAADALREGTLVAPFKTALRTDALFRMLCPIGAEKRPHIKAFLDWVALEVEGTETLSEGRRMIHATDITP